MNKYILYIAFLLTISVLIYIYYNHLMPSLNISRSLHNMRVISNGIRNYYFYNKKLPKKIDDVVIGGYLPESSINYYDYALNDHRKAESIHFNNMQFKVEFNENYVLVRFSEKNNYKSKYKHYETLDKVFRIPNENSADSE